MYQPTLGRFSSRDPLAEDGVDVLTDTGFYSGRLTAMRANPWSYGGNWDHPYAYARNNPCRYIDPSGMLTVEPLGSNLSPKCGQSAWIEWDFVLAKKAPCDGYIVQQIDARCTIDDCCNCPKSSPLKPDLTFWEAWFVNKGDRLISDLMAGRTTFTDTSTKPVRDKKCGTDSSSGTIKFFCMTTTGDLGKPGMPNAMSGWKFLAVYGTGDCKTTTGAMPTTDQRPPWWNNVPIESASRWFSVYWNCCCHDKSDFIQVDASPK
jgi:hypothetical protein